MKKLLENWQEYGKQKLVEQDFIIISDGPENVKKIDLLPEDTIALQRLGVATGEGSDIDFDNLQGILSRAQEQEQQIKEHNRQDKTMVLWEQKWKEFHTADRLDEAPAEGITLTGAELGLPSKFHDKIYSKDEEGDYFRQDTPGGPKTKMTSGQKNSIEKALAKNKELSFDAATPAKPAAAAVGGDPIEVETAREVAGRQIKKSGESSEKRKELAKSLARLTDDELTDLLADNPDNTMLKGEANKRRQLPIEAIFGGPLDSEAPKVARRQPTEQELQSARDARDAAKQKYLAGQTDGKPVEKPVEKPAEPKKKASGKAVRLHRPGTTPSVEPPTGFKFAATPDPAAFVERDTGEWESVDDTELAMLKRRGIGYDDQ